MKRSLVIAFGLMVLTSVVGCGHTQTTAASWAFNAINWNHRIYRVTSQTVEDVGQEVTSVTNAQEFI